MTFRTLSECLRALYGNDAIDRLEAAPELGRDRDAAAFGDAMTALADLTYEPDAAEQARFEEQCARELAGEFE